MSLPAKETGISKVGMAQPSIKNPADRHLWETTPALVLTWPIAIFLKYVEGLTGSAGQGTEVLSLVLWPSAVYIAGQLLDNWVLTPWIQSGQTNLNAATIIIVVFIGAALAGVLGMLLAIPVAACIKILFDEVVFAAFAPMGSAKLTERL